MTPEGRVKAKVKKAFEKFGRDCWRFMPVQTGRGAPALDFLFALKGRFVAIETKAPGNKPTPMQEQTIKAIRDAGGLVFVVWDDVTLDAAIAAIHLALEFDNDRRDDPPSRVLLEGLSAATDGNGKLIEHARRVDEAQAWRDVEEHEGPIEPAEAPDTAAGGDHGAPGASSE